MAARSAAKSASRAAASEPVKESATIELSTKSPSPRQCAGDPAACLRAAIPVITMLASSSRSLRRGSKLEQAPDYASPLSLTSADQAIEQRDGGGAIRRTHEEVRFTSATLNEDRLSVAESLKTKAAMVRPHS
jgi:hypothetical protein